MHDTALAYLAGWTALHAALRNGNYAVTMFFVISGFLITSNTDKLWRGLRNIHAPILLLAAYLIFSSLLAILISRFYSEPLNRRLRAPALLPGAMLPHQRSTSPANPAHPTR